MSVFISYSSKDSSFAERLALSLVESRIHVWIDKWEIKPGDSLIDKIQGALTKSSFLLVILSENSVNSEWCKKELNSGLIREIESKEVVLIPVLLEKCEVPLFLKEKLYADFSKSFDDGLKQLLRPLSSLISDRMTRQIHDEYTIDYAVDWGLEKGAYKMQIDALVAPVGKTFTLLIQTEVYGDNLATTHWEIQVRAGLDWVMKEAIILMFKHSKELMALRIRCTDNKPQILEFEMHDPKINFTFHVRLRARMLGNYPGNDILFDYRSIIEHLDTLRTDSAPSNP
jgi:hypothetical protein